MAPIDIFTDNEKSILHGFASLRTPLALEKVVVHAAFPLADRHPHIYESGANAFHDLLRHGFIRQVPMPPGGQYWPLYTLTTAGQFVCKKISADILNEKAAARLVE